VISQATTALGHLTHVEVDAYRACAEFEKEKGEMQVLIRIYAEVTNLLADLFALDHEQAAKFASRYVEKGVV